MTEQSSKAAPLEALADPVAFAEPDKINALYKDLRDNAPVQRVELDDFPPFWVVTRHDDIKAIEAEPEVFLAGTRTILQSHEQEKVNLQNFGDINGLKTLVHMDGKEHLQHRMIAQSFFAKANIERLRDQTRAQADSFIDKMASFGGQCDFATDVAFWFPLRVVLSIMGVPEKDDQTILEMTQALFGFMDPDLGEGQTLGEMGVVKVIGDFSAYVTELIARKKAEPGEDLATVLANAEIDGEPIDPFKQLSYFILVVTAGHDTTSASIAEGMKSLIQQPDAMDALREDLSLCETAADEFVRLAAPVKHFLRTPTKDVEIAGTKIKAGETLMLAYPSAARDDRVFDAPDQVTVDRPVNQHLAFGFGPHVCLGKHLARMETEIFFQRLLPRLETVSLAGPIEYMEGGFVSGIKKMPVTYKMV
ncbi:MAG: cytochrome P450 [Pseudomonadota bacterium]